MHFDRRSAPVRKERTAMKYAFDNANLIDGTQDMRALRTLDMVVARGRIIDRPRPKRNARLDAGLDTLLA